MSPPAAGSGVFAAPGTAGAREAPSTLTRWNRAAFMQAGSLLFALALLGRAAQVQILERGEWRRRAQAQQIAANPLPAPRGTILDANGAILVESRQLVKLSIAPREVAAPLPKKDDGTRRMDVLVRGLARAGVSQEWIGKVRDTTRAWIDLPGHHLATDVATITGLRGVHAEPALDRVPPSNDGLRRLIGRADDEGGAIDGLEKSLDAMLRGTGGRESLVRDAKGHRTRSPNVVPTDPTPGHTVILSLNQGLQDIAERALGDAVRTMRATGGDIVMLDPATGEVRAMASLRENKLSTGATALTEPYEPGSTLKPFFAARLLDLKRARTDEIVNTYGGKWELNKRKIIDDHPMAQASLSDVIRYSSNIGIIQFAQRMTPPEQYDLLRDLGLGTPTGLPYPSEAAGIVPAPRRWDGQTQTSLAMGYAVSVTPLQLATAYAAIANGGELLEPAIVKEIRTPDGQVKYRHERRVVRRVMSVEAARELRLMLKGVVETGTATGSSLSTFDVAGKTGTAKRAINGRYAEGKYNASFVGMFPAEDPQLVILVKLDDPTKSIYGGKAAAPVSKVVLQAAIAARDAALDRRTLASAPGRSSGTEARLDAGSATEVQVAPVTNAATDSAAAAAFDDAVKGTSRGDVAWVARVNGEEKQAQQAPAINARVAVPDVRGLPVRRAVYELHRAGFRTSIGGGAGGASGSDRASGTSPAAGSYATTGATIVVGREP
jgi:cell division protein FtsI (penicillin-binding protein 3)